MRYTKMHGAGNSFLLTESLRGELEGEDLNGLALRLCDRRTGPGADGLIVLVPAEGADFGMLFFNSDGSPGEMCGNGARCVCRYGVEHALAEDPRHIRLQTPAGLVTGRRIDETRYQVRLNDPSLVDLHRRAEGRDCAYVELGDPGIPHAVVEVAPEALDDPGSLRAPGRALRFSPAFPRGANVSFYCLTGPQSVRALTFERGVEDFTLACGTGSGAIALCLILGGRVPGERLEVQMPGGTLELTLHRQGERVKDLLLTGPTALVEEGDFPL